MCANIRVIDSPDEAVWFTDRGPAPDGTPAAAAVLSRYELHVGQRGGDSDVVLRMGYSSLLQLAEAVNNIVNRTCTGCGDTHETGSKLIEHQGDLLCPPCLEHVLEERDGEPVEDPHGPQTHAQYEREYGL